MMKAEDRSFPKAANGLPTSDTEVALFGAGCDPETARFVARQLSQQGFVITPAASRPVEQGDPVAWAFEWEGDGGQICVSPHKPWSAMCRNIRPLYAHPAPAASRPAVGRDAGMANLMEELWRDAEDECERLASGVWPSDEAIAECFHEHRRETERGLPPWSQVMRDSGIWKHSHDFVCRLRSLRAPSSPDPRDDTRAGGDGAQALYDKLDGDSLDAICEVIGEGEAFRKYNRGKSAMRDWFLGRLRTVWNLPEPPSPAPETRDDTRDGGV